MISVVIPAHNEERYLGDCVASVTEAASQADSEVEVIVVLNRCTDGTEAIARSWDARLVHEPARNLSMIRNAGARAARGELLVTIDADSRMSPNMLSEVERRLCNPSVVGGGVMVKLERWSIGIFASLLVLLPFVAWYGVSAGMFWCRKRDFDAVGGFDEGLVSVEDVDFGRRLKRYGRTNGMRYHTIWNADIVTSARKFDRFGDWFLVRDPMICVRAFRGTHRGIADRLWYAFDRNGRDRKQS
ncbi:MAG: glycosyltransferase [Opitutales bacterium]